MRESPSRPLNQPADLGQSSESSSHQSIHDAARAAVVNAKKSAMPPSKLRSESASASALAQLESLVSGDDFKPDVSKEPATALSQTSSSSHPSPITSTAHITAPQLGASISKTASPPSKVQAETPSPKPAAHDAMDDITSLLSNPSARLSDILESMTFDDLAASIAKPTSALSSPATSISDQSHSYNASSPTAAAASGPSRLESKASSGSISSLGGKLTTRTTSIPHAATSIQSLRANRDSAVRSPQHMGHRTHIYQFAPFRSSQSRPQMQCRPFQHRNRLNEVLTYQLLNRLLQHCVAPQ